MAEHYLVRFAPDAERRRRRLPAHEIRQLDLIVMFLSVSPHPRRGSLLVTERRVDGVVTYRYVERGFHYAVEYRVFEPETDEMGLVVVTDLQDKDEGA